MKLSIHPFFLAVCFDATVSASQKRSSPRYLTKLDELCTAVIVAEQWEDGKDEQYLNCLTDSGLSYKVDVEEDFISTYFDEGPFDSNEAHLIFESEPMVDKLNNEIVFSGKPKLKAIGQPKGRKFADTIGDKTILVVWVNAANDSTSATPDDLGNSVFGTNGDPVNIKSQYAECSHNQLNILPADDRTGSSTSISEGVVSVTVATSTGQGDGTMRNDITAELNSQFGVSGPYQLADLVMYCLPPNTMSGIAYAYINSWNSVYSDYWCTYLSAQMHEVGHNLNLGHSNENGAEYNDQSGMMGYSYSNNDGPLMCFNAAKMWQLQWYTSKQTELNATPGFTQYVGELAGLMEDYYDSSVPTMVIKLDTPSGDDYFLFFNRKSGFNSETQEGGNSVIIVTAGAEGEGYSKSDLKAKLTSSQSWTSPVVFEGEAATVTVNNIGTRADVQICVGSCVPTPAPTPAAPTVSPRPTAKCFDLDIEILPDQYASAETSWELLDTDGTTIIDSGGLTDFTEYVLYEYKVECLPSTCGTDDFYTFNIMDTYGDGLNWSGTAAGYFKVFVQGTQLFGTSDGVNFGQMDTVRVEIDCGPSPTTMTPSASPTSAPSSSPSTSPTVPCVDSGFSIAYTEIAGGTSIPCEFVSDFVSGCLCSDADVSSHCPFTCNSCGVYGCVDSTATFYTPTGTDVNCSFLYSLNPDDITSFCNASADLRNTCRALCGVCDN